MTNKRLIQEGKSAGTRPPVLVTDVNRTKLEISWLETEAQTIECRHVDIENRVPAQEWGVHLLPAHPGSTLEQRSRIS